MNHHILTMNSGSSSIKFSVFAPGQPLQRLLSGEIERIGLANAVLRLNDAERPPLRQPVNVPDHEHAVAQLIDWLKQRIGIAAVGAVGHRVVHGGPSYSGARIIDANVIAELKRLSPLDPAHLPGEIALIEAFARRFPGLTQVACFDTAFHHDLPQVARLLPIPRRYEAAGVRRYGFHGLSYAFLMEELAQESGGRRAEGGGKTGDRIILAHLGSGASMAAVRGGKCIDTTMSFTPTAGLVMGTRCGDLDPGLLIHWMRSEGMNAEQIDDLLNRQSGLLGISETSPDMRDLLAREAGDPRAAEAVNIFCYQAKKWLGAFVAVLGGLDTLVFAGGIGENSPPVRARICAGLEVLGIRLDEARNTANAALISADASACIVRVIRTDEELMIAREVERCLNELRP